MSCQKRLDSILLPPLGLSLRRFPHTEVARDQQHDNEHATHRELWPFHVLIPRLAHNNCCKHNGAIHDVDGKTQCKSDYSSCDAPNGRISVGVGAVNGRQPSQSGTGVQDSCRMPRIGKLLKAWGANDGHCEQERIKSHWKKNPDPPPDPCQLTPASRLSQRGRVRVLFGSTD